MTFLSAVLCLASKVFISVSCSLHALNLGLTRHRVVYPSSKQRLSPSRANSGTTATAPVLRRAGILFFGWRCLMAYRVGRMGLGRCGGRGLVLGSGFCFGFGFGFGLNSNSCSDSDRR
jgi:hypothetical protein